MIKFIERPQKYPQIPLTIPVARKILFFTESLAYGGDDTILIQLIRHWPDPQDALTVALNESHPGWEIYQSKIGERARIRIVPERTIAEEKAAASATDSAWRRRLQITMRQASRLWKGPYSIAKLARFFRREAPDALILSSGGYPLSPLTWRALCAAWLCSVPHRILAIHNYPEQIQGLRRWLLYPRRRLTPFLAHRLVSVSDHCARELAAAMKPFYPLRILNGVDADAPNGNVPEKLRALGNPGKPLIGAVGNLEERKGFHVLISAMKRVVQEYPGAQCVIIGANRDEEYRRRLAELIRKEHLESSVRLIGFLPDAGRYVECFDVCVMPSVSIESFGLAALEAMRCGRPVVTTRVGGIPEIVEHERTGLLVEPGDAEMLAWAILRVLREPKLAERLTADARETFKSRFTADRMAREYYRLTK